jgi:cytochrome oxidase Cu insertion factor (SCO1/SenC/PrrC family)
MNDVASQNEINPGAQPVSAPQKNKKNPYTIWFVVLSFVAPVILAYIMYFFVDVKSFTNHGEILNPIVHVSTFKLKDENGLVIPEKELQSKWRIISFLGEDCDQQCATRLYDTRQVYTSLGKDRDRVVRMFVHLEPASDPLLKLIAEEHQNVIHVNADKSTIVNALGHNVRDGVSVDNNETYIMDPLGNVMMRFTQDQPNKDFLQDLRKLLKASQIG